VRRLLVALLLLAACSDDGGPADPPAAFTDRTPVPRCGTVTYDGSGVLDGDERDAERCLRSAADTNFRAELEVVRFTEEGTPIRTYLRALEDVPGVEVFIDTTASDGGRWRHLRCGGLADEHLEALDCRPVTETNVR
jgi:hypothetical protein